jgi:hypothetical protein
MILKKIHVSWRKGKGGNRHLIGYISRKTSSESKFLFEYQKDNLCNAQKEGFISYPDFPDLEKTYSNNLKAVFSLRLMPKTRLDRNDYLSFWNADNGDYDWFDELGFTQGKLATDNFEFLADFPQMYNGKGINFVSEVAALSHLNLDKNFISIGDSLKFEKETTNKFDPNAVKILKDEIFIGYVKKGHNLFFQKVKPENVEISVKNIEKNGRINQIYFSVKVNSFVL